jgi:hypothetical protein
MSDQRDYTAPVRAGPAGVQRAPEVAPTDNKEARAARLGKSLARDLFNEFLSLQQTLRAINRRAQG